MEAYTIHLKEPLIIPKNLDENFLFMVDSSQVQLWPQIAHLCETERLSLEVATKRIAALASLRIGIQEWYLYKMRSLLRTHFADWKRTLRSVVVCVLRTRKYLMQTQTR